VLIVDEHTQRMLNSVLTTYDILEEGVQRGFAFYWTTDHLRQREAVTMS
jgi:histidinol phosphatase-like PHP family hydrolase